MTRWGKEKTGKGLSVASRAKAYLPGGGMSYGVPDEALIHAWSEWLTEAMRHIDELEAELGGGKEETAEERVRADIAATGDYCDTTITEKANLRAILAELDRVRAERDERTEGWRKTERKMAKLSKDMHGVSGMLFESKVEVERLRSGMMPAAQRPVDIEAVLAPIQRVLSAYRTAPVYGMKYELLARHVVDDLGQALAEAEKIARGE